MTDETPEPDEPLDGALARARDAIAAPPPPLDETTHRRLVTRALAERAPQRAGRPPSRVPALLAAAAAVAVVALGGWALLSAGGGGKSDGSASKAATAATTAAAPYTPSALGEVSDPHRLLDQVRAALRGGASSTAPKTGPAADSSSCLARVKTPPRVTARPFATASYRGAPAVVFVARDGRETLIYVLDRRDCRLLTSQFFQG